MLFRSLVLLAGRLGSKYAARAVGAAAIALDLAVLFWFKYAGWIGGMLGVSMGAATTMMLSSMQMPKGIKDIRFIEDCGYTSVWDEFEGQLKEQFGLPAFPLLYTSSLLCRLRYGWSFGEASAMNEVAKCPYPMLFIHGDKDTFVPTKMVYRLYDAKPEPKALWVVSGVDHALSYKTHQAEYTVKVHDYLMTIK